ncbi:MAG: hypothetical protein KBD53_06375 [Candidatus Omnitrophica bacterium]|nr:hypothetical protein [Candidatus Omnitrophota bacterium]
MKTLKIFILIAVFCLISIILSKWIKWDGLEVSDPKWVWIHSKIFNSPRQTVDYVFIGSSRTWCGVKAKQIENAFPGIKVWNFGRHWTGRDIDYLIIKDLLEHHDVKHIFVEIIGKETFSAHSYAKFIMPPDEAVQEARFLLKDLTLKDILTYSFNLKERMKHITNQMVELSLRFYRTLCFSAWKNFLAKMDDTADLVSHDATGGFYVDDAQLTQNPELAEQFGRFQPFYPVGKGPYLLPEGTFPDYYLNKIHKICQLHHTELSFVFISGYVSVLPNDQMFHYFHRWGELYIPTLRNIYKMEYWRDKNHVYQKGAEVFTDEIISLLKNGVESSEDYRQYIQKP